MTLQEILILAIPMLVAGHLGRRLIPLRSAGALATMLAIGFCFLLQPDLSPEGILTCILLGGMAFYIGLAAPLGRRRIPVGPLQYRYCPNCSTPLEHRMVDENLRDACPNCDFVHWNNPITVGVMIIPSGDGIVLVKRGNPPKKGMWALPGGFGDPNECPNNTAVREALEETCLQVEIDRLLGVMGTPDCNQTLVFYLAKPVDKDPVPGSDALEARVFPLDALPEIAFETHSKIIKDWMESR